MCVCVVFVSICFNLYDDVLLCAAWLFMEVFVHRLIICILA